MRRFRPADVPAATGRPDVRAGLDRPRRRVRRVPGVEEVEARVVPSLTITLDYSYDSNHFFDSQARRDLMQQAANTVASLINDSLAAIVPGGANTWTANFPDPSTGQLRSLQNLVVPANTLIIYVGGGPLGSDSEAGLGSTGGYNASGDPSTWLPTVQGRGQPGALATPATDFAPWGGSIMFDASGTTHWYFGQSTAGLTLDQTDFLSVAEHEVGHVLGLGTSDSWQAKVSGGRFNGPAAIAAYGQAVPLSPAGDHWADDVQSDGGNALMDPVLTDGTRVTFTRLDLAGLKDVGWQVQQTGPPVVQLGASTYRVTENDVLVAIPITRTGGLGAFTVQYSTLDGTARNQVDYQWVGGTLNFAAGETSKTIIVPVLNDHANLGDKTFSLRIWSPTAGALLGGPSTAVTTIVDVVPMRAIADFGPDGRTDPGVYRPATSTWYVLNGGVSLIDPAPVLGAPNLSDWPVTGDFDGTGRAQVGVYRPSTGEWFVQAAGGGMRWIGTFGDPRFNDIPVPGDYDGIGRTELAVYRPGSGTWFVLGPNGWHSPGVFGLPNLADVPTPGDYDGDGRTEMAVYRRATGQWFVMGKQGWYSPGYFGDPSRQDVPVPGDYDGIGRTELAVYRPGTGQWFVLGPGGWRYLGTMGTPNYVDIPIQASAGSLVQLGLAGPGLGAARTGGVSGPPRGAALTVASAPARADTTGPITADSPATPRKLVRGPRVDPAWKRPFAWDRKRPW